MLTTYLCGNTLIFVCKLTKEMENPTNLIKVQVSKNAGFESGFRISGGLVPAGHFRTLGPDPNTLSSVLPV